jgi:hypothetical protein
MENLQQFASSSNGDRWYLGTDEATRRTFVLHRANDSSGGHETRTDVQAFLNAGSMSPERQALITLLGVGNGSGNMQSIKEWLESRIPELVSFQKHREQKADLQLEAKALWLKAEAAGYSVAELKEACNGDVEQYLLDMQNISASAKTTT